VLQALDEAFVLLPTLAGVVGLTELATTQADQETDLQPAQAGCRPSGASKAECKFDPERA
jgi:hypothetical protein